ncbi:MAG: GNAT family N-acetyltransferase [Bacilli bacterium]|nr:GNAT family N-acetyltransferase [Bacilli bacterium]
MNAEFDVTGICLETERLLLRPWLESDLNDLFEYASVPGVGEMAGWSHHESLQVSKDILNRFIEEKKAFAIVFKENYKVIGSLGVEEYDLEDKLSEFFDYRGRSIGYVLSKDYWGRGLMPEAVNVVVTYLFHVLDYDFLLSGHFDRNGRSRRVQEKCGFIPYRKLEYETQFGTKEPGVLMLLTNPKKAVQFQFSHPETLLIS